MAVAAAPMADTDIDNSVSLEVASHTQSGGSRKGAFRFSQFVLLSLAGSESVIVVSNGFACASRIFLNRPSAVRTAASQLRA